MAVCGEIRTPVRARRAALTTPLETNMSWKTTAAAIAAAIGAIGTALAAMLDADPATLPDWGIVGTLVIASVGLFFARDNDKSS